LGHVCPAAYFLGLVRCGLLATAYLHSQGPELEAS